MNHNNFFGIKNGLNIRPTTLPVSGNLGDLAFDNVANVFKQWNGTTWSTIAGSGNLINNVTSASCGAFSTTSVALVAVTNLHVTITTTGNPVILNLISDGTSSVVSEIFSRNNAEGTGVVVQIRRNGSIIAVQDWYSDIPNTGGYNLMGIPSSSVNHIDKPPAGTYTYEIWIEAQFATSFVNMGITLAKLNAYELGGSSNPGTSWVTSSQTGTHLAANNDELFVDTSGGVATMNLPATPGVGFRVKMIDYANTWGTNNVTVGRSGSLINGVASDYTLNVSGSWVEFVYIGSTQGWKALL